MDSQFKHKARAAVITLMIVILCFCFVIFLTDHPVRSETNHNGKFGAIAIRDDVIPFQKYGTRLFSHPYLNHYYADLRYFTERYNGENREQFIGQLKKLLSTHDSVDVYLLAHSNEYFGWIAEIDSSTRKRIRMVYNTGCSGASQGYLWKNLGVKYYVAHESSQSISPVFYFYFLRRICNGQPLNMAITESNKAMHEKLTRIRLLSFGMIGVSDELESGSEGKLVITN